MRVLVVRVGAMGDVLHGLPAVAGLRAAMPEVELGWCVEPRWRPLLESAAGSRPLVDRVHATETRLWSARPASFATARSILRLRAELRRARYDAVVDLQGSVRSAVIARIAGARRVVGLATPRETPARWFYTERVEVRAKHVVEQAAELLSAVAGRVIKPEQPELPVVAADEAWAETVTGGGACVLLAPQAGWGAKQWPAEHFAAVARALAGEGLRVLVNAAGEQDAVAAEVVERSGGCARAVSSSVAQLVALTRRMRLVVAGDTGPLHLAAALGRPVVALFGPTDPARTGPWHCPAEVLRHPASATDHRRHATTEVGLEQIDPGEVVQRSLRMLHNTGMRQDDRDGLSGAARATEGRRKDVAV